jgi:hypothetical protein
MNRVSRREFTRTAIAVGAGSALSSLRVSGANDRVNVGLIGCGDRGQQVCGAFLKQPDFNPVAVCDVYQPFLEKAATDSGGNVSKFEDFRRLLELKTSMQFTWRRPITGTHWRRSAACEAAGRLR